MTDFKVLTFDCYGTLIDWESGMFAALQAARRTAARPLSRDKVLEAHARPRGGAATRDSDHALQRLLAVVHKRLAEEWGVSASWDDCLAYGRSIRGLAGLSATPPRPSNI